MEVVRRVSAPLGLIGPIRAISVAALALIAGACSSAVPPPVSENRDKLAELFSETYRRIEKVHIVQTDTADLALGGLHSLAGADENLIDEFLIVPRRDGTEPGPRDYDAWGAVTSEAVVGLVTQSEHLQALKAQEVYDLFSGGLASQLAKPSEFFPGDSVWTVLQSNTTRKFDMGYDLVADGARIARLDPKGELEEQGLKLGDIITHIEGTPTAGLPKVHIFELLGSGLEFGSTTFTVRRTGAPAPITLDLWESSGAKHNLRVREHEGVAEYRFVYVDHDSTKFFASSVSRRAGRPFRGLTAGRDFQANSILLDLRNTPDHPDLPVFTDSGAAVRLAGLFLNGEPVGSARSRNAAFGEEWHASKHVSSAGYPLVIVVDSTTSGAAEIAVAALQDQGRALVVGSSTAGDGKLHALVALPTGGDLVTPTALAYSPSGYPIEGRGITPNICTSISGATLDGLLAELRRGEAVIPEDLRTRVMAPDDIGAIAEQRALCPLSTDDGNLAYNLALSILRDPELSRRLLAGDSSS